MTTISLDNLPITQRNISLCDFSIDMPYREKIGEVVTVDPTLEVQTITPSDNYHELTSVNVNAVTNDIDNNIQPTNIRLGVSILGIEGNLEPDKPDQTKTANPTTSQQIITPDTGYELASVTINAVNPSDYYKEEEPANVVPSIEQQTIIPTDNKVFNQVNVGAVTSSIDENIQATNIKKDVSILGVVGTVEEGITPTGSINIDTNGTHDVTTFASATVNVQPSLQDKTVTQNGVVSADDGYYGLNDVTVNVASSGDEALIGVIEGTVTELEIPTGTTKIGKNAFYGYSALTSVTIPSSVTAIYEGGFAYCSNLNLSIPNTVKDFGAGACRGTKITSVDLNNLTYLGNSVFFGCSSLTSVKISGNACGTGTDQFYQCSNLLSADLGEWENTSIPNNMFAYCSKLSNVILPPNATELSGGLFESCAFTTFTVPSTITKFASSFLVRNSKLVTLNVYPTSSINKVSSNSVAWCRSCPSTTVIHIPSSVTDPITAYGQYWNYYSSSGTLTYYADL